MDIKQLSQDAKAASLLLAAVDTEVKNLALSAIAGALDTNRAAIIAANEADLAAAEKANLAAPLLKRLNFQEDRIDEAVDGVNSLIALADPVGVTQSAIELDQGLTLRRVSCPIGVIGIVFESRPDALVQISSLCLKSGNAVLMKGGREAARTNRVLTEIIRKASGEAGMPEGWLSLLEARSEVDEMLKMEQSIDLIIPRGSNEFVRYIMDNTSIPVLGHADGVCHVYIDSEVDVEKAIAITVDSKTQYVAACNAAETLLVHRRMSNQVLPRLKAALEAKGVELRGCEKTTRIIDIKSASEQDWHTEYLDLILSIKVVETMDEAIAHINHYGSHHTDVIVTNDQARGKQFINTVDSACVFVNCSSRFSDGYRFGLGAEVGISTSKIHARGPVGMEGLLIYKWQLIGSGHVVASYSGKNARSFTHRLLDKTYAGK